MYLPLLRSVTCFQEARFFGTPNQVRQSISAGGESVAVLVTCSELGFQPDLLTGAESGQLSIIQTVGGLVVMPGQRPAVGDAFGEKFDDARVEHLIFCGHSNCLVYRGLLESPEEHHELLVYRYAKPTCERMLEAYGDLPLEQRWRIAIQEAVLQQASLVCGREDVSRRLGEGSMRLHIWIRDDETAKIAVFDPEERQFMSA